jgi:integrase
MQTVSSNIQSVNPMFNFLYALKAPESKRQYPKRFEMFLDFLKLDGTLNEKASYFYNKAKSDPQWLQDNFMRFIEYQKERVTNNEISANTISNYYKATKLFCEMNNIIINWKIISKGIPSGKKAANDRAPTIEEIQQVVEYPDRRIKPIVYVMISSGIRLGAWDYLKWKHVSPIKDNDGEIVAAKLLVYAGDKEEYISFITPEAYAALEEWVNFRKFYGEEINGESWVMRDIWQVTNLEYSERRKGIAKFPKKLQSVAIKRIIERALWAQKIRHKLNNGERRHEWKTVHGFRKFFKTRAEQVMKPANVEILMGHSIGISDSYYRPSEREVLEDYLKAVDLLTINDNQRILEKQVTDLKEKSKDNEILIKAKIQEREKEIKTMKETYDTELKILKEAILDMQELMKHPKKLSEF